MGFLEVKAITSNSRFLNVSTISISTRRITHSTHSQGEQEEEGLISDADLVGA